MKTTTNTASVASRISIPNFDPVLYDLTNRLGLFTGLSVNFQSESQFVIAFSIQTEQSHGTQLSKYLVDYPLNASLKNSLDRYFYENLYYNCNSSDTYTSMIIYKYNDKAENLEPPKGWTLLDRPRYGLREIDTYLMQHPVFGTKVVRVY